MGLSGGAIAGIVVGVVVGVALIAIIFVLLYLLKKRSNAVEKTRSNNIEKINSAENGNNYGQPPLQPLNNDKEKPNTNMDDNFRSSIQQSVQTSNGGAGEDSQPNLMESYKDTNQSQETFIYPGYVSVKLIGVKNPKTNDSADQMYSYSILTMQHCQMN